MENELTIFMARVISLIYLPVGIALLVRQFKGKEMFDSMKKSTGLTLFIAVFGLVFGMYLVQNHNIWVMDWPVLVTILGWVAVVECVLLIAFPKALLSVGGKFIKYEKAWGIAALIIGLLFGYLGFFA